MLFRSILSEFSSSPTKLSDLFLYPSIFGLLSLSLAFKKKLLPFLATLGYFLASLLVAIDYFYPISFLSHNLLTLLTCLLYFLIYPVLGAYYLNLITSTKINYLLAVFLTTALPLTILPWFHFTDSYLEVSVINDFTLTLVFIALLIRFGNPNFEIGRAHV